ncbi:Meiotic Sister-Chromatid recombination aldehyde dehydrogenase [Tulasnella sp. 418]|nr:Meiotic Sister-Chromatid recombination aldehyde dehydrogenase [Tulasnella sp. 418]
MVQPKVMTAAAVNLTPVVLELGGKDPAIILPNTDLERWASTWMRGAFGASGQNCVGIERFIIHRSQHDEFINLMAARIRKLRLGSVLSSSEEGFVSVVDGGSMISDARFAELERLVKAAEHDGAQVVTGGERWTHAYLEEGAYFPPTLIGHVNENMEIAQTEVFAPIMLVIPYDDVQEAVAIANGSRYGLGASVFGRSQSEAVIVAHQLECGMVSINDFGVFYLNQDLPFGGVKGSGFGRFAGPEGLRGLCNTKVLVTDRWPWLVQTKIPAALDYPIRSLVTSWYVKCSLACLEMQTCF